ncbi:chromosome partitioning protein ParB [Caballeronia sp. NK8]|nr:chromosome partitioning protein ParB [Caballeronia sp. NK8]
MEWAGRLADGVGELGIAMKTLRIDRLRPTQFTHGMREIRDKTKRYQSLTGHDLQMAIAEKPVPVVLGPHGAPFAIDHHHVATALWRAKIKTVPFVLVRDLSSLSRTEFWLAMENNRWTYPYDSHGRRVAFVEMREQVWDLEDDEFRSLAAFVRDAGGYLKTSVPLEEFRWADFFRHHLPLPKNDDEFDALVKKALKLARSEAALGLPGYLGPD